MPSVQQIMMSFPTVTSVVIGPSGRAAQAAAGRNGCRGARFKFFLLLADSAWTRTDSESRPTRTTVAPSAYGPRPPGRHWAMTAACPCSAVTLAAGPGCPARVHRTVAAWGPGRDACTRRGWCRGRQPPPGWPRPPADRAVAYSTVTTVCISHTTLSRFQVTVTYRRRDTPWIRDRHGHGGTAWTRTHDGGDTDKSLRGSG